MMVISKIIINNIVKFLATVIREVKRCMYNNQLTNSTNKIKTTWNVIKAETNRLKGPSNTVTNNFQNSPEAYSRYFLFVPKNIIDGIRSKNNQSSNTPKNPTYYLSNLFHTPYRCIKFRNTSAREIEKIINSLKVKDSFGYDEISIKTLKISAPFISSPLSYICNKSMLSGTFPTRLKYAIVKPILKKGNRENITNYRPVSLMTSFSEVFERIIYDRLLKHIKNNNILHAEQFGFRVSSSTEKASYKLIGDVLNALNNKLTVGGIFCDLQKAFDCTNHNI
jgi:hypothetical protein